MDQNMGPNHSLSNNSDMSLTAHVSLLMCMLAVQLHPQNNEQGILNLSQSQRHSTMQAAVPCSVPAPHLVLVLPWRPARPCRPC